MRRGWWVVILVGIAMVPVVILLLFDRGDDTPSALNVTTSPVLVGQIDLQNTDHLAGSTVEMDVKLRSDRNIPIDGLEIQLNDTTASTTSKPIYLKPHTATPRQITPRQITIRMFGTVATAGRYSYFLGYHTAAGATGAAQWHYLPPYDEFTVQ